MKTGTVVGLALVLITPIASRAQVPAAGPLNVTLSCGGVARGLQHDSATGSFTDNNGGSATGDITTTRHVTYDGRLRIRIEGDQGSIRVPGQMMPKLRGKRDEDGAFKLTDVAVNDRTITGQFSFNFINKPKFVIDRATGEIEMSGFGNGFSGTCEKIADEPGARKF